MMKVMKTALPGIVIMRYLTRDNNILLNTVATCHFPQFFSRKKKELKKAITLHFHILKFTIKHTIATDKYVYTLYSDA